MPTATSAGRGGAVGGDAVAAIADGGDSLFQGLLHGTHRQPWTANDLYDGLHLCRMDVLAGKRYRLAFHYKLPDTQATNKQQRKLPNLV